MHRTSARRKALRKFALNLLLTAGVAGAAIFTGETLKPTLSAPSSGLFCLEGRSWWAPDYGQCAYCGGMLTAMLDQISACRHCPVCDMSYRHRSLPNSLEEQERVWR